MMFDELATNEELDRFLNDPALYESSLAQYDAHMEEQANGRANPGNVMVSIVKVDPELAADVYHAVTGK